MSGVICNMCPTGFSRADMVRAIVGQQWAVAVTLLALADRAGDARRDEDGASLQWRDASEEERNIGFLPPAVAVVAAIYGGG